MVLVHGTPDTSGAFAKVLAHLAGLRVITYDRRGYGRSVHLAPMFPLAAMVAAVGLTRAVDAVAATRPMRIAAVALGLGLWEPPTCWVDWWVQSTKDHNVRLANSADPGAEMEGTLRRMLGNEAWEAMPVATQQRRRAEGAAYSLDMASILEAPFDFADVSVTALVGCGTETAPEHRYGAAWLCEQLPDAELYEIEGAGHFANRTHPAEFAAFVRAAVARASGSRR